MTKRELFELLASVPEDAPVYIMGAKIAVIVYQPESGHVVLDEKLDPFKDGGFRLLFLSSGLIELDIRYNNCAARGSCAACGCDVRPDTGWQVFASGTYAPVCDECVASQSPQLLAARDAANAPEMAA
jgi:hypothetical protein